MDMTIFYERIETRPELEGIGVDLKAEKPGVLVKHDKSSLLTKLSVGTIQQQEWPVWESVSVGRCEPNVFDHMPRMVGYFSCGENLDKSKLSELKDRQNGDYAGMADPDKTHVLDKTKVKAGMAR